MQAVILAAGRARRLGPIGESLPKCLVRIGGRPLIAYSLDSLVQRGVREITIVTGHRDGAIQDALGAHHLGVRVHYRFNPHYRHTGSLVSLMLGASGLGAPNLLVLESDLLYHPGFLDAAMAAADDTLLVADASGSGDEVFVCRGPDDRLSYLGKNASPRQREDSIGEYAGIARLSAGFCAVYRREAERLLRAGGAAGHYEDLIFDLSKTGHAIGVRHCPFLPWTEIDTVEDIERATNAVYPALRHIWERAPREPDPAANRDDLSIAS
jgi:choline kinase